MIVQPHVHTQREAEFAINRDSGNVQRACQAWCAVLAERAGRRCFTPDKFVTDGLAFARNRFGQISDERLKVRVAIWVCAVLSIARPGDPDCETWEDLAFSLAERAGTPGDNLAVGVVASARRVWQGVPVGRLADHRSRLDALAALNFVDFRAAIAWVAARTHCDLQHQPIAGSVAQAAMLAECLERSMLDGGGSKAGPLESTEFVRHLSAAKVGEATAYLHRLAHLAHRLAPYDAWVYWFYKTSLSLAAGDPETAMLDASRALACARQSGVPHTVFWAKLASARAFGTVPARSGVWRRLADARREARALGVGSLVALCRLASALVAIARGHTSRAAKLVAAALPGIEAVQLLRPPLFTSEDFALLFRSADAAARGAVAAPMLRSLYASVPATRLAVAVSGSHGVEIRCLGAFSLARDGHVLVWPRKAPRRPLDLLKATIALGRYGAPVAQLTDALWPEMEGDRAQRAFGTALYRLRGLLGDEVLELSAGRLTLDRARVWVDAFEFEDASAAPGCGDAAHDRTILSLYGGAFLPDQTQDGWATATRDRLREVFRTAARRAAEQLLADGHWRDALDLLEEALKRDPLAEIFYQHAIAACAAGGLRAEASAYYERCRGALSEHFGVSPSARTESLYCNVLRASQ